MLQNLTLSLLIPNSKIHVASGAILCSHLEGEEYVSFITSEAQLRAKPSQSMSRDLGENSFVLWTQIVFTSSQSSPGRPREEGGKTQQMGPISHKRNALKQKNENKANLSFPPPPPICIWKDYKPKEKVARTVPLTSMHPSLRFSGQFTILVFSSAPLSPLSLSYSSIPLIYINIYIF